MSKISDIFDSYQNALTDSRDRYSELYTSRIENGRKFYDAFFHKLIIPYRPIFSNPTARSVVIRNIERFFGTSNIDFVAIDGTCTKDSFTDFLVFFGGAYGAKGRVSLEGDPGKVRYHRWEINRDVSMVAWVPIPFAELSDISDRTEETFMLSGEDRVNLSGIHTSLMQLAEIYLAYNVATGSSIDAPKLIMLDQSLSGIMAATSHGANSRLRDQRHINIAFAHPFNSELGIPSSKLFRRYAAVIAEFHKTNTTEIKREDLEKRLGLSREELRDPAKFLINTLKLCEYDKSSETLRMLVNPRDSWKETLRLFQSVCTRIFIEKDQSALIYDETDPEDRSKTRRRWMSGDDIQFLISIGLRALVEECWTRRILLIGIVKDSESRYITRNYLGSMKHIGQYSELESLNVGLLPWTDRIYLETIPTYCDDVLESPWSSIEFDSAFITLHLGEDTAGPRIMGVKTKAAGTEIVAPERLFLRSLAQFFISRNKKTPLMGHVVFVDRLAFPSLDRVAHQPIEIKCKELGSIKPFVYADNTVENIGQLATMYLLTTLTKNHFPEVIGYPDPLHKADWGAKSVGRRVKGIIGSSEIPFRSKPMSKTLRAIRDKRGR